MTTPHAAALGGLAALRQFFLYRITPHPDKPGKTLKTPTSLAGKAHGAEDARHWMTLPEALAACPTDGWAVGVAITENDPYFFIDVDGCVDDAGNLSPIAQTVLSGFPGAFMEYSTSGRGIHIIGRGVWSPHRSKRTEWGVEFYTEGRGCALNFASGVTGNADTDHTQALQSWWCRVDVMGPRPMAEIAGEGPRASWNGPTDDDDLLRRALRSQTTQSLFGGRASFADLWNADLAVLAQSYPTDVPGLPDRSSCDMALAAHLAFWTGCDAARMYRLMMRSGLRREKWDRPDYLLERTIPNAIGMTTKVLCDKPLEQPETPGTEPMPMMAATYASPSDQMKIFAGCVYVLSENKVWSNKYKDLLKREQFDVMFGGRSYAMDLDNTLAPTKKAFDAFTNSQAVAFPKAIGTIYRPQWPSGEVKDGLVNIYVDDSQPAVANGDISLFMTHMHKLFPADTDRAIMLAYMAAVVQHQGIKFGWAPVIQGVQGNGKTTLADILHYCVGSRNYGVVSSKELGSNFTGWLVNKVFIVANDLAVDRNDVAMLEMIKPIISDLYQRTEVKGGAQEVREVTANFMVTTNRRDAVRITANERRWAPFFTPQQNIQQLLADGMGDDMQYFQRLRGWLDAGGYAAVKGYLAGYAIPDALNPAKGARRAPVTTTQHEAIQASHGTVESILVDAIKDNEYGFCGGFIAQKFAEDIVRREMTPAKYRKRYVMEALTELGYVPHPSLIEGRVNNAIGIHGRLKLWVKLKSIVGNPDLTSAEIEALFAATNKSTLFG